MHRDVATPHVGTVRDIKRRGVQRFLLADSYGCFCQHIHDGERKRPGEWRLCEYHEGYNDALLTVGVGG